ncbi:uncharacterized protein LOC62_07G009799 [Vanrija pseudolonga]|uniref:Uncharacterized protein n=1 Tax=Vanrija pseudolonga TaxID=143232 RepID=A0AAF0YKC2_9TREE|nr:hypothetical protein LOC62_07G009799 [Vanrija pseudolonga]
MGKDRKDHKSSIGKGIKANRQPADEPAPPSYGASTEAKVFATSSPLAFTPTHNPPPFSQPMSASSSRAELPPKPTPELYPHATPSWFRRKFRGEVVADLHAMATLVKEGHAPDEVGRMLRLNDNDEDRARAALVHNRHLRWGFKFQPVHCQLCAIASQSGERERHSQPL